MKEIKSYKIIYHQESHSGMIHLHMADKTTQHFPFQGEGEAALLLDILRNEKPVFYDKKGELFCTGFEPVGEGETSPAKPKPKRKTVRRKATKK